MLARFQNSSHRPACSDTLGMRVTAINQAEKSLRMDFDVPAMFANPMGSVQGGFIGAMLDEAMAVCCVIASNLTKSAPTLEMKTSYLKPLMPGPAYVEAQIIHWGASVAFVESVCFNNDGVMVAKGSATMMPKLFKRF